MKGPKRSFIETETHTCISKNIEFGIICKRCNIIYIVETCRRLANRITEHIRSIGSNFSLNDFSVTGLSTVIVQM